MKEGWTWLENSTKWHYFRGKRSLCGRWMMLTDEGLMDNPPTMTACKECLRLSATKKEKTNEI